jgi:hypothetical protein
MEEQWTDLRKRFDALPSRCAKRPHNWLELDYGIKPEDEQNGLMWRLQEIMTKTEKNIDKDIDYPPWYKHPTVKLTYPFRNDEVVEIDTEIAELIQEMWKAGVKTSSCCQGNGDEPIWIRFPSVEDYRKLVEIVWTDTLYNVDSSLSANRWKHQYYVGQIGEYNLRLNMVGPHHDIPDLYIKKLYTSIGATMPRSDIPFMLSQLKRHNLGEVEPNKVSKSTKKLKQIADTTPYITL